MSRKDLVKSLSVREKMVSHFNSLWYEDYLLSLRSLYKNLHGAEFINRVKENDLVLIKNPVKSRQHWCLGKIVQLIHGADDKVRFVKLLRGDAKYDSGTRKLELHSIKNLYPLELNITHNKPVVSNNDPLLDLEVVDLSTAEESDTPNTHVEDSEQPVSTLNDTDTADLVAQGCDNVIVGSQLKFTYDLDPEEVQAFRDQEKSEPLLEGNSGLSNLPDTVVPASESGVGSTNVSSRGRTIRPPKRPLDHQFQWGDA